MTAQKKAPDVPATPRAASSGRKPWIRKTPAEIVLEQITKQEEKVNEMRAELAREERLLAKMAKAKTAFEAD